MSLEPFQLLAQFLVAVIIFLLCMRMFFSKLLWVLQERESKTTLLAKEADQIVARADQMTKSYKEKVEEVYGQAQKKAQDEKEKIIHREVQKYREEAGQINQSSEREREKVVASIRSQRALVLQEADDLADSLVDRFVSKEKSRY